MRRNKPAVGDVRIKTRVDLRQTSSPPEAGGLSPEPAARLLNAFAKPFSTSVAAARTCYSSEVVTPQDVEKDERSRERRHALADSIYRAGHHTTLQHAEFQFVLENVSRLFIWSFLHSHPFYNSEQVSQRYVPVEPGRLAVPPLPEKPRALFQEIAAQLMTAYERLTELVYPSAAGEYERIFPLRNVREPGWGKMVRRRAQEAARYVLPLATHAHLYHTVSGLTLHRYHRLCLAYDAPLEQRTVVEKMLAEVRALDPLFVDHMEDPLSLEETPEYELFKQFHENRPPSREFLDEFDRSLGGRISKLVDYKVNGEAVLAQAVRSVLGVAQRRLADETAIDAVLDPSRNRYLGGSLNLASHSKLMRALLHMNFTFRRKLSHAADSQDQRHRMTPASRPLLAGHQAVEPDYIVPSLVKETPAALELYGETFEKLWKNLRRLSEMGVKQEFVLYLLPNAVPVRYEESGDLLHYHHKWSKRLCYLAQEEIWRACLDEVAQVKEVAPRVARHLGPPCALRSAAGQRPFCPEGDRFCGVKVWQLPLESYRRLI